MGPDDFQYAAQDARQTFFNSTVGRFTSGLTSGVSSLGNFLSNLDEPEQRSPTDYQYAARSTPAVRSPTDFQHANNTTTTTVDVEGGTSLFDTLKNAAKDTLLTGLDAAINRATGAANDVLDVQQPQPQNASYAGATVAGFPIAAVVGVAVVGGFLVWKYG